MIEYILYLINLIKLRWNRYRKKYANRFDKYLPFGDLSKFDVIGLLNNESDWDLGTPNLARNENVSIIASNSYDKSSLSLKLKWRPNSELGAATLISQLKISIAEDCLIYQNVATYKPTSTNVHPGRIVQYGAKGSYLRLFVVAPYRKYRLVFRGLMQSIGSEPSMYFVKLNLLIAQTSKVYDFQQQFDIKDVARQIASKRSKCNPVTALESLILHDKHEQTVKVMGEYCIDDGNSKKRDKIHLWGFHSRLVIDETMQKMRSKQILGMFKNGRAFHLGVRENVDNNFDSSLRFELGYACFNSQPAVAPTSGHGQTGRTLVDWNNVTGQAKNLEFTIEAQGLTFRVSAKRRDNGDSAFLDMLLDSKVVGWGIVLINDDLEASEAAIDMSLRGYKQALDRGQIANALKTLDLDHGGPLIVDLDDSKCVHPNLVGAKASSLAQLRAKAKNGSDYKVPSAVVLTRFAYEEILKTNNLLSDEIRRFVAQIGQGNVKNLESDCLKLMSQFRNDTRLPPRLIEELKERFERIPDSACDAEDSPSLIVRSSSWGEDEEDMSAAGQLTSVLSVRGFDKLLGAVMECFASKFSFRNVEYKRQRGLPVDSPMAVIVQEQIGCDKAGVMFTCDPVSGDPRRVLITANYGLGESVVSARTDPDSIKVRVLSQETQTIKLEIEEVKVGSKENIITESDTSEMDRGKCCLTENESVGLAQCGLKLADYFQQPCDIEWGWKDGCLYLFQSRPITGLDSYTDFELMHESDEPSRAELDFYTRCNINEVLPYAVSPAMISYIPKVWKNISFRISHGLKRVALDCYCLDYFCDFPFNNYHAFLGLRSRGLFDFTRKPGQEEKSLVARSVEIGMFGHEVDDQELIDAATEMVPLNQETMSRLDMMRYNLAHWRYRYIPERTVAKLRKRQRRLRRDIQSLRFSRSGDSLAGLWQQIQVLTRYTFDTFKLHYIATNLYANASNLDLLILLSKYIKEPTQLFAIFSNILAASPNVLSGEVPRGIERMAKLIAARGSSEAESFVALSSFDALKYISSDMKSNLAREFDTFMVKFGHRSYNEFELSHLPWRETPEVIADMIKANVSRCLEDTSKVSGEPKVRTLDSVLAASGVAFSFLDRLRLKYCTGARAQRFVAVREQTKDLTVEFNDLTRDAYRLLARAMRQSNRIPDEDLFFYVFCHEVEALIRDYQPSIVAHASKRRKMFRENFAKTWRFDEIIRVKPEIVPDHLKNPGAVDVTGRDAASNLRGVTASSGKVEGKVCLVGGYEELHKVKANDIMVTFCTDIAFAPVFPIIAGVITEVGGLISHGAVVAREYGLPSVIGIKNVTKLLKHGEEILLDADNGVIVRLDKET